MQEWMWNRILSHFDAVLDFQMYIPVTRHFHSKIYHFLAPKKGHLKNCKRKSFYICAIGKMRAKIQLLWEMCTKPFLMHSCRFVLKTAKHKNIKQIYRWKVRIGVKLDLVALAVFVCICLDPQIGPSCSIICLWHRKLSKSTHGSFSKPRRNYDLASIPCLVSPDTIGVCLPTLTVQKTQNQIT